MSNIATCSRNAFSRCYSGSNGKQRADAAAEYHINNENARGHYARVGSYPCQMVVFHLVADPGRGSARPAAARGVNPGTGKG